MRTIAKLFLNNLWGRYCLKPNKRQNIYCNNAEVYDILSDSRNDNVVIQPIPQVNDDVKYHIGFNILDEYAETNFSVNEVIGVFTTAYARIKLYNLMDDVGFENVLYHDTDSVIYIENKTNMYIYNEQLGDYLGELTDELYDDEKKIYKKCIEYVATAPKSYSLLFDDKTTMTKVKGFSLNFQNSQSLNHNEMKNMFLNDKDKVIQINYDVLRKPKKTSLINKQYAALGIETTNETKTFSLNYDKGFIQWETYNILPWGHKDIVNDNK